MNSVYIANLGNFLQRKKSVQLRAFLALLPFWRQQHICDPYRETVRTFQETMIEKLVVHFRETGHYLRDISS